MLRPWQEEAAAAIVKISTGDNSIPLVNDHLTQ